MKSARERAIKIVFEIAKPYLPYSEKLFRMMLEEAPQTMPGVVDSIKSTEEAIEADRKELLAWAKEEG